MTWLMRCGYYGCGQQPLISNTRCYLHDGLEELEEGKICTKCEELKPLDSYHDGRNGRKRSTCKSCSRVPETRTFSDRVSTIDKRNSTKSASLKNRFSVSLEEYVHLLFVIQEECCALCTKKSPTIEEMFEGRFWPVDHDHRCCPGRESCGKCIRGVLCDNCNNTLKALWENMEWREKALSYLDKLMGETHK